MFFDILVQWVLLEAAAKKYPVRKKYGDAKSTIERGATMKTKIKMIFVSNQREPRYSSTREKFFRASFEMYLFSLLLMILADVCS
jgi:hypothetical protein